MAELCMITLDDLFDEENDKDDDERYSQVSSFNDKLQEILLADPETSCLKDCLPVACKDLFGYPSLSAVLCNVIEKELEMEGYLLPPVLYKSNFLNTIVPLLREHTKQSKSPPLFAKAVIVLSRRCITLLSLSPMRMKISLERPRNMSTKSRILAMRKNSTIFVGGICG